MTDPKIHDRFVDEDEPRHSHDMLETAREIRVSPEEQEEAVAREEERRLEQATQALHEQAVAAYEAAVVGRQRARSWLITQAIAFGVGNAALFAIDQVTVGGGWFRWPLLGWSLLLATHAAWFFTRAKPTAPPPLPPTTSATDTPWGTSLRSTSPRPLAGRGREDADTDLQSRARTTERTSRKQD
jgi:hypothetical protein